MILRFRWQVAQRQRWCASKGRAPRRVGRQIAAATRALGGGQPTLGLSASRLVGRIAVTEDWGVPVRVLIVDDNPRFRLRARRCLEASVYEVVAEAADGASALEAARRHRPAVVLLDIELPDTSGTSVAEWLAREPVPPAVVLTSTHDAADFGARLLRCGARGFIPKAELSSERLTALLA